MLSDVQKTLVGAKEMIQARGWAQGRSVDRDGCVCMVHAISESAAVVALVDQSIQLGIDACAVVREIIGGGDPIVWNDDPKRTQAEIEAVLTQAADKVPK